MSSATTMPWDVRIRTRCHLAIAARASLPSGKRELASGIGYAGLPMATVHHERVRGRAGEDRCRPFKSTALFLLEMRGFNRKNAARSQAPRAQADACALGVDRSEQTTPAHVPAAAQPLAFTRSSIWNCGHVNYSAFAPVSTRGARHA